MTTGVAAATARVVPLHAGGRRAPCRPPRQDPLADPDPMHFALRLRLDPRSMCTCVSLCVLQIPSKRGRERRQRVVESQSLMGKEAATSSTTTNATTSTPAPKGEKQTCHVMRPCVLMPCVCVCVRLISRASPARRPLGLARQRHLLRRLALLQVRYFNHYHTRP
jgi:hypothetical protein